MLLDLKTSTEKRISIVVERNNEKVSKLHDRIDNLFCEDRMFKVEEKVKKRLYELMVRYEAGRMDLKEIQAKMDDAIQKIMTFRSKMLLPTVENMRFDTKTLHEMIGKLEEKHTHDQNWISEKILEKTKTILK